MNHNYQFLNQIQQLVEMHKKQRELSGENFNIFSIMNMESDEVRTHSALITELLNPKGSHSLGIEPLKLFYKIVLDEQCELNLDTINCVKEEHVGFISEDKTEGGRLDIVVKDGNENGLVIENKIYAGEQINQLSRYSNRYPKAKILYLTLEGNESQQITSKDIKYQQISYKQHITEWVTACSKLAYDKPVIRETLKQYLFLIKKLTNQTTSTEMSDKIIEIIKKNFEASSEIYSNFEKVLTQIENDFLINLKNTFEQNSRNWMVKITDYKSTKAIELKRENITIRYRIKNHRFSVYHVEGINSVKNILTGFSEKNVEEIENKTKRYWYIQNAEINPETLAQQHNEVTEAIKQIIQAL